MISSHPINAEVFLESSKSSDARLDESYYQDGGSGSKQKVAHYPHGEESNQGPSEMEIKSLSENGQSGYHSSHSDTKPETSEVI